MPFAQNARHWRIASEFSEAKLGQADCWKKINRVLRFNYPEAGIWWTSSRSSRNACNMRLLRFEPKWATEKVAV